MVESALCITAILTDGADVPMSIKQEPDDDPQTVFNSVYSDVKFSYQQHLADHNYCEVKDCKDGIPIINIAPIVTRRSCGSKPEEDNVIVKSEIDDTWTSSETSNPTFVKCGVVPNVVPNLPVYEVKNEFPCTTQTEIVHNNRLDVDTVNDSELVEVPGELDCKPEIVGNVSSFVVLGDVNIQTSVQHNDTVNQKLFTSMNNCEMDVKEEDSDLGE